MEVTISRLSCGSVGGFLGFGFHQAVLQHSTWGVWSSKTTPLASREIEIESNLNFLVHTFPYWISHSVSSSLSEEWNESFWPPPMFAFAISFIGSNRSGWSLMFGHPCRDRLPIASESSSSLFVIWAVKSVSPPNVPQVWCFSSFFSFVVNDSENTSVSMV